MRGGGVGKFSILWRFRVKAVRWGEVLGGGRVGSVCIWGRKRVRNGESQLCAHDKSGFWRSKHPPKV